MKLFTIDTNGKLISYKEHPFKDSNREEEIQQAIGRLKLERAEFYEMKGKIISQWNIKTLINGIEIDLGDASAYIKIVCIMT